MLKDAKGSTIHVQQIDLMAMSFQVKNITQENSKQKEMQNALV